ncbi:MAG: M20/M25/M40 family metallo-hydrolase [bacterium]
METKNLIKKLIATPSITANKQAVNQCSDFVSDYLKNLGLNLKTERINGYKIIYASTHKSGQSDIIFNSHLDVVDANKNQFKAVEKKNKLLGRGVLDCKGHAAVIMNLLPRLKGIAKVGAIFSTDEETGGLSTKYMVNKGYIGKFTIVLDGNFDRIIIAQKGVLSLILKARGKACHSSAPWRGENAIDNLINGYLKIKKLFAPTSEKDSWKNTCAATIINGGVAANQVPDHAEMNLNIRFTDKTNPKKLINNIRTVSGLKVDLKLQTDFLSIPENDGYVQGFYKSMKKRMNNNIEIGRMNGATDARHFARKSKSIVITGLKGGGAHAADEWLNLDSVKKLENALYWYIKEDWKAIT